MGRQIAIVAGILLAAACGYLVAYLRFNPPARQTQGVESRLEDTREEVVTLREQRRDLQQRLEQVSKEQERLAQENEVLRKQQITEELVSGHSGGELPALPPK